ncbi:hypothetical protein ACTMTJ_20300 [Phytohabitans sp. LJ34]|uniref:hypothetical protein n=1 Tax=Phytohabitans sp. LJ34 TaxID=3452217 RepID=UPI003F8B80E8
MTVLAAVLVTLFVVASPAAADPGWERIPCFSGAIEHAEATGGDYITLTGYLDCGVSPDNPGPRWGYAAYIAGLPHGTLNDEDMHWYSFGDRTAFSNMMLVEPLPELGICVVTDYDVRIACVKVTRKSSTSPVQVWATSVDDELVNKPFQRRSEGDPNPVCGHC